MKRRDFKRLTQKHGERLRALVEYMERGQYHFALEALRRLLGDRELPPEIRVLATAKEVEAFLALGQKAEAQISARRIEVIVERHRLWSLRSQVQGVIDQARGTSDSEGAS